ncbi:MAG: DUF1080 domain-containing protein [Phycisphaerae bacterium]
MTATRCIRPLAAIAAAGLVAAGLSAAEEKEEGFVSLFNGKDLTGWEGSTKGYVVRDGVMVCKKEGGGNLWTTREFSDFHLKFEFRLTPGANNGLGIRMAPNAHAAYQAMELQILDDSAPKWADLKPYQYHGSIYGVVPAKRGHLKPVGEWNRQEVIARKGRIQVILNGTTIVDADVWKIDPEKTMDGRPHPGLHNKKGHIGFLGHGAHVEFRNLRIKDLAK